MSTLAQPKSRTALTPPATVECQTVWEETPTRRPEAGEGDIISITDIIIIGQASLSQAPHYMAAAKVTWGRWEANSGCTYYPDPLMVIRFRYLRMSDATRNEVQGRDLDIDEERKYKWYNAEPKIVTAAADHNNWMLRIEFGGAMVTDNVSSCKQTREVKLWGKRVVGDEEVKLGRAGKDRLQIDSNVFLAELRPKESGSLCSDGVGHAAVRWLEIKTVDPLWNSV
ncbi:hypothetical protein HO133_010348 [Letharia lupina]|uniref:Uncharacterized protein n=1 Tax=Letharia lupina TaxID=560253 RepID=A0A8H6CL77_9LECA|nr:uncharacterized protein HO133_010348 [Letharia lupina]KAF6225151.1 hypothetical protein HO133_010348 [Letharia lupina]